MLNGISTTSWMFRKTYNRPSSELNEVAPTMTTVKTEKGMKPFQRKLLELTGLFDEIHNMFEHLNTENEVLHEQLKHLGADNSFMNDEDDESAANEEDDLVGAGPNKQHRLGSVRTVASSIVTESRENSDLSSGRRNKRASVGDSDSLSAENTGMDLCIDSQRTPFYPEWPTSLEDGRRKRATIRRGAGASLRSVTGFVASLVDDNLISSQHGLVLSPVGWFRLTWDLVCFAFLVCQLWTTLFSIAFIPEKNVPAFFDHIEDVTTLFFFADLVLNFNTGVIRTTEDSETIVMKRSAIFREYCSGFFWIDLLSTIPFDRLLENVNGKALFAMRLARVARWLKLLRLLRVVRAMNMIRSHAKTHVLELERLSSSVAKPLAYATMLAVLAHSHACIWQSFQDVTVTRETMFELYWLDVSRMFLAITSGERMDPDTNLRWAFDVLLTAERLVIFGITGFWLVTHAWLYTQNAGTSDHLKREVLAYLKLRSVNQKTQMAVLSQLNEANSMHGLKRSYLTWVASGVPHELHAAVCEELWSEHLTSLGLIQYAFYLEPRLKVALCLLVQEETFAKNTVVFKEGDQSLAAYMVLYGVVNLESSLAIDAMPDTTENMWLGEKALVNHSLPRTMTATCKQTCTLMVVPAHGFQQMLSEFSVSQPFEEFCVKHMWKGICGRCGVVGDHFADKCPLNLGRSSARKNRRKKAGFFSLWCGDEEAEQGYADVRELDRHAGYEVLLPENTDVPSEYQMQPDLIEFLRAKSLGSMYPLLERHGIRCLLDLQELRPEHQEEIIAAAPAGVNASVLRSTFAHESVFHFVQSLEERAKHVLGIEHVSTGHLVFLSHHKLEGGTEAALLLRELEVAIQDHPILGRRPMERPVFLDSDDLDNLEQLQEHVAKSHNLLLLLTSEVLLRPWVLIEIATATRIGAPIIPLKINKPGNKFEYPDDAFYEKIADGSLIPRSGFRLLRSCGISPEELEDAVRKVFNRISLHYSPHESSTMRNAELEQILKVINFRTLGASPRSRPPANFQVGGRRPRGSMAAPRRSILGTSSMGVATQSHSMEAYGFGDFLS